MILYRTIREKFLDTPLSGVGASLSHHNRWNSHGTPMVYCAGNLSLAILETVVHLDINEDLPNDRYYAIIEVSNEIDILEVSINDLSNHWNSVPPGRETQVLGDKFITSNMGLILKVPSTQSPTDFNYLLNPSHPDMSQVDVIGVTPLTFDPRIRFGDRIN